MDPQPPSPDPKGSISSWDENDVQLFFANLGFPQYEVKVKGRCLLFIVFLLANIIPTVEHNLTGDVLCLMGPEDLKEIGIATVGQRLAILKAIYIVKLTHDVPFEPDHYIPPC
jgi:bZIP factor